MKSLFNKYILILLAFTTVSCFNKDDRNYQYFPDMYEPIPYEPYGDYEVFPGGQSARLPAEGSISRGWMPYDYDNDPAGFQAAKAGLTNPVPYTESNLAAGRQLYTIYCATCHGDTGDGQGVLVQREKILGIPRYDDQGRDITEGSVYHVMYYGLNAMGSYASQTTSNERWLITNYVMKLKNDLAGGVEMPFEAEESEMDNLIPAVNKEADQISGNEQGDGNGEQDNQNEE